MANIAFSTPGVPFEDASVFRHTATSRLFSRLLADLGLLIEMERDIEHVDVFEPAFSGWLTDAEQAHESVSSGLLSLLSSPIERAEDRALQRMAFGLHTLMKTEAPGEFRQIYDLIQRFPSAFVCPGSSAFARRSTKMLATLRLRMADLLALTAFNDDYDVEPDADVPDNVPFAIAAA